MNRKIKNGENGELVVAQEFAKLSFPYLLINNLMLEDNKGVTHQVDHILICYKGIFVVETKNHYGVISSNNGDSIWLKNIGGKISKFGNPIYQNISHIRAIKHILKNDYEYISLVVFVKNNAPYLPDDNVINFNDLILFINEYPNKQTLSDDVMKKIYQTLLYSESDKSVKTHLKNIKKIKDDRKEKQKILRKAIEKRICPECKNKLISTSNGLKCSNQKCKFTIKL